MSDYSIKFYAENIRCKEEECNFSINNITCTSNSENFFRDIWICENPESKGLISAKIKCRENEITPLNTCFLQYHFNRPMASNDSNTHTHPTYPTYPPIHHDPKAEFLFNLFFYSFFGFVFIMIMVVFIRLCTGECADNNSNYHPHPTYYTVNGQQFCDNPNHFTTNSNAPPPYEIVNSNTNVSTPLLNGSRSKHCTDPRCQNYLKPYLPRNGINPQEYQAIPSMLITHPEYDYYNPHHNQHHNNHHYHYHHRNNNHHHNNAFYNDHHHHSHHNYDSHHSHHGSH